MTTPPPPYLPTKDPAQQAPETTMEPEHSITVTTSALKLQLIANRLQTFLESGDPKALHLLTQEPGSYASLTTLLPPTDVQFGTHTRNAQSAITVGSYQALREAIEKEAVSVHDIGVIICDGVSKSRGVAGWIFERIKGEGVEVLQIEVKSTATAEPLATTTARLYDHTAAAPYPTPPNLLTPSPHPSDSLTAIRQFLHALPGRPSPLFTGSRQPPSTATLHLPNYLPRHLRTFRSRGPHPTFAGAQQDAAVEALVALQRAEDPLLDDTYRPLFTRAQLLKGKRSQPLVPAMMDPWCCAGMSWDDTVDVYCTALRLQMGPGEEELVCEMLTLLPVPAAEEITVYWDRDTLWTIHIGESSCRGAQPALVQRAQRASTTLLRTVYKSRMDAAADARGTFAYLFSPRGWTDAFTARRPINALTAYGKNRGRTVQVVQDKAVRYGGHFICTGWRPDLRLDPAEDPRYAAVAASSRHPRQPVLEAVKFPSRRDLLHPVAGDHVVPAPVQLLPEFATSEPVPLKYWKLALVVPGVVHRVGIARIAQDLQQTLLAGVVSVAGIIPAICAPSARESSDYQRLEFLGDLALNLLVMLGLLAAHPNWHEEYLTPAKSEAVSNGRLAKAAVDAGLGRWIVVDVFTGAKWRPRHVGTGGALPGAAATRQMSDKVLADVVEALVGAAWLEGGVEGALRCVRAFGMCGDQTTAALTVRAMQTHAAESQQRRVRYLAGLEGLLEYEFRDHALLLEAITHPAHSHSPAVNYGRLLILGDAILDIIVGRELFDDAKDLGPVDMTNYKSSVVSGNLLAFLSMGWCDAGSGANFWRFVHVPDPGLVKAREELQRRYDQAGPGGEEPLKDRIQRSLDRDANYPWAPLSLFEADSTGKNKHLSDIVNAVIAAVYIDSGGGLDIVTGLVERLGVLKTLRRLVAGGVNVVHPVSRLEENVAPLQKGQPTYICRMDGGGHVCTVTFDGRVLAVARSASSKSEARAEAAQMGLDALENAHVQSDNGPSAADVDGGWD
ncbi:hypothetical protein DFP73DRAFT_570459 [Morchella snyderi]|nr:hypothetical protein DFP73DRAFT_570459 [Morchella snyderi]